MLDVHPPEHTPHTWRDFFIHIATIVVGLVIAVGLEQAVVAIQHHREANQLRVALQHETLEGLKDSHGTEAAYNQRLAWLKLRIKTVKAAIWNHQPIVDGEPFQKISYDYPYDPIWLAAKTNGRVALLSDDEINAYSEVESTEITMQARYNILTADQQKFDAFENEFPTYSEGHPDLSVASTDDLRTYLGLLTTFMESTKAARVANEYVHADYDCIHHGELDLSHMFKAENQYDTQNGVAF